MYLAFSLTLIDLPEEVKIAAEGLLALPHEFLLPATILEQARARNSVNTWLNTLPPPLPANNSLHFLADTALAPLNLLSTPAGIRQVTSLSPSLDGIILDTDNLATEQQ
jgi:hypothetical protein